MAFYLKDYEITLKKFLKLSGRNWMTISEAKEAIDLKSKTLNKALIFRHDVDREPYKALKMAKIEANFNIKATYYFRCNKGDFPVPFVDKISKLGHEVGYHYECLSSSNGDKNKALKIFKKNLLRFRSIAPCTSVSMHGKPLSPYNNQDLLVGQDLKKFDLLADAVLSFVKIKLIYLTDTGGKWGASARHNLRDHVGISKDIPFSPMQSGFVKWLDNNPLPFMLTTHPERWATGFLNYVYSETRDQSTNIGKDLLRLLKINNHK